VTPYYERDGITIYHADCREIAAELAYDVIVSDPPYGTGQRVAYDVYRDYMPQWRELMAWLLSQTRPMVFTLSHTRLFDLEKRPQWIGCWDKVNTNAITWLGAGPTWEPICFYNMPIPKGGRPSTRWDDVLRYAIDWRTDLDEHPCRKPIALYRRLISIMPEGAVFDPCMGTGTTLRAAKDLRRRAIGCDVSERYCEIAAQRLAQDVLDLVYQS